MSSKGVFRKMETGLGIHNANFPMDPDGRTYHVGVKRGEVANRVISVGDPSRAERLAELFDEPKKRFVLQTNRGFTTHTGLYKGVPVTVVATGMGVAMADFLVREVCAVTDGPMVFIRFGTCGSLVENVGIGRVCVASQGSIMCHRYEDAWLEQKKNTSPEEDKKEGHHAHHGHWSPCDSGPYYQLSRHIVPADSEISRLLVGHLQQRLNADSVSEGLNCTADTFYASQGRTSDDFDDHNNDWLQHLRHLYPHATTLEMETYQFFHLAQCSKRGRMRAGAACIVLANRVTNEFLGADEKHRLEVEGGKAILDAVIDVQLDGVMDTNDCVWKK